MLNRLCKIKPSPKGKKVVQDFHDDRRRYIFNYVLRVMHLVHINLHSPEVYNYDFIIFNLISHKFKIIFIIILTCKL